MMPTFSRTLFGMKIFGEKIYEKVVPLFFEPIFWGKIFSTNRKNGSHFFTSKNSRKIFSTNCLAYIAKNPRDRRGRGFRPPVGGSTWGICLVYKRKTPSGQWNFTRRGRIRNSASAGRTIPPVRRPRIACFFASVIFQKRVTGFEWFSVVISLSVLCAVHHHFLLSTFPYFQNGHLLSGISYPSCWQMSSTWRRSSMGTNLPSRTLLP